MRSSTGWIGIASDSHAHREVEAALRSSQELFRQFAEHSTDVLWILDAATLRAEYLSPAFEKVWGLPRGALAGSPERNSRDIWLETVHPEDRGPAAEAMARVREGEVSVTEYRITRADGAVRRIRDTFFPIRDAASRVSRVAGIAKDVTQHEGSDVYIVDGEPAWHSRLSRLLEDAGYRATVFGTVGGFLEAAPALVPGCVLLNLAQPEAPALAVPRELKARRLALPVIVTSQCHDVGMAVRAMKAGAADFLPAPARCRRRCWQPPRPACGLRRPRRRRRIRHDTAGRAARGLGVSLRDRTGGLFANAQAISCSTSMA